MALPSTYGGGYRLVLAEDALPAVPLPGVPSPRSPLIGRRPELDAIRVGLEHGRLVTLVGLGGMGKTHLAQAFAARVDAVWVDLGGLTDESAVLDRVTEALGVSGPSAIVHGLRVRGRVLVVLDQAEDAIEPVAQLASRWLDATAALALLVTSRLPLGLAGERRIGIEPLPEDDAVTLFVARLNDVGPDFASTPDELALVAAIVRELDQVPLALELAASRARAMPLAELHTSLSGSARASPRPHIE